jgi:uncharacterized membrane protein YbhN (UPF0104 family)
MISPRLRRWWPAVMLAVTGSILYYVFTFVPIGNVVEALRGARIPYVLLVFPLVLASPLLSAGRLKVLTDAQGFAASVWQLTRINLITSFYILALPGQLAGGVIRWHKLSRLAGQRTEALAAVAYSRLYYLAMLTLLGVVFLVLDLPRGIHPLWVISLVILFAFLSAAGYLVARADRSPLLRRLGTDGPGFVGRLASATGQYRRLPRGGWLRIVTLTAVENLAGTLAVYLLAVSVSIEVPFTTIGWIRAVVLAVTTLPISISGLGVREGGLIVLLEPFGVAGAAAVALSFLMLARNLLLGTIGAALEIQSTLTRKERRII